MVEPVSPGGHRRGLWGVFRFGPGSLLAWTLLLLVAALVGELVYTFGLGNLRTVIPGRLYRAAQPKGKYLESLAREHGIKTVFNLRGCCDPTPWYLDEAAGARAADLNLEDFSFSAGRLPSKRVIKRLIEAIDGAEEPVLIHCHQGIDRTGMVAALWLLLKTNTTIENAYAQLSLRYVHLPWGRTGNLDRFLDSYRDWLIQSEQTHHPDLLREWINTHYIPGAAGVAIKTRDPGELTIPAGRPSVVRVDCLNQSIQPWVFKPGTSAGIHLYWYILTPQRRIVYAGISGLFETTVPPGESITLEIPVPGTLPPGDYLLRADLDEPWHARFVQMNGSIFEETLKIRAPGGAPESDRTPPAGRTLP